MKEQKIKKDECKIELKKVEQMSKHKNSRSVLKLQ